MVENMSRKRNAKKQRTMNMSETTPLEHLSDKIFHEVFEYLDGCDIFHAFSTLNIRFQKLLSHTSLRLKTSVDFQSNSQFQEACTRLIVPNCARLISLRLLDSYYIKTFLQLSHLNASFIRLEALVFIHIKPDDVISLLPTLTQLPRLSSLSISLEDGFDISNEFYQIIFRLPHLKSSQLSTTKSFFHIPSSIYLHKQISQIEKLIIDHRCDLNQLIAMLSCTPQLRRLSCRRMMTSEEPIRLKHLTSLPNLTHLFLVDCQLPFRHLRKLIEKIASPLQVLRINTSQDSSYLNTTGWEQLVLEHLPKLRTFYFEYKDFSFTQNNVPISEFTSSFWTDRQWIFDIKADVYEGFTTKITYSIHPRRETWFKMYNPVAHKTYCNGTNADEIGTQQDSLVSFPEGTEFIVHGHGSTRLDPSFMTSIDAVFPVIQITCLHISYFYPFTSSVLVELVCLLPNLDSLIVTYVAARQIENLSEEQLNNIRLASSKNRITRVRIGGLMNFEQLDVFINLCPKIQHLEIGHTDDIDRKVLIQTILMANIDLIPCLCSLYLWIPGFNETFIKRFQKTMYLDKLIDDYTITYMNNGIDLQWNRYQLAAVKKLSYRHLRKRKH